MNVPGDNPKKNIVCDRVWVETNYHTLLVFMAPVEEMHIATGVSPWTGNISRKKVRGYLMLVAFNLEQI